MSFSYQTGFNQSFSTTSTVSKQNYAAPQMQQTNCMPCGNMTSPIPQPSSPEAMICGMKNMLQGVFGQFQQTAAVFQQFLTGNQPTVIECATEKPAKTLEEKTSGQLFKTYEKLELTDPMNPKTQQYAAKVARLLGNDAKGYFEQVIQKNCTIHVRQIQKQLEQIEPDSVEAQLLKAKLSSFLPEATGDRFKLSQGQLETHFDRQSLLSKYLGIGEPDSPEAQSLKIRINNLNHQLGYKGADI